MGVVTFVDYTPTPRFDGNPWTTVRVQEAATADGTFTTIETFTLSPVDADPENPIARSFTTELASDTLELWYRLVFLDATGDEQQPTTPVQNSVFSAYASTVDLARILNLRNTTAAQEAALRRVLTAAAGEINAEIDLAAGASLESWQLALAAQVNLDRAADLWRHTESIPGVVGLLGDDGGPMIPARYSWERYAQRLAPLKNQWGIA